MVCRARKIALRAPAPAAAAIAVVLVLLTSVDAGAQQPYYPYPCPFISGGRDLDGDQLEGPVSFDPRTGVWSKIFIPPATVTWGQWGDLPTPGDFDGDGVDDVSHLASVHRDLVGALQHAVQLSLGHHRGRVRRPG